MLKPYTVLTVVVILSAAISGCSFNLSPPSNHQELCDQLKRQAVLNASDRNIEATYTTAAQKQAFADRLRAAQCN